MAVLVFLAVIWIVPIVLANKITSSKGRGNAGFVLGLFLGWLGVLIAVCLNPAQTNGMAPGPRRPCPHCAEPILYQAKVCHWCHGNVEPADVPIWPPVPKPS